jgi:hypothetical protein
VPVQVSSNSKSPLKNDMTVYSRHIVAGKVALVSKKGRQVSKFDGAPATKLQL